MGLLDDPVSIEIPQRATLSQKATYLLKKHTTRRGKKKKKPRDAKWLRKVAEAKEEQAIIRRQLAEHYKNYQRNLCN